MNNSSLLTEGSESLCCFSKYLQTWKNLSCMLCCHRNWEDFSISIIMNSFWWMYSHLSRRILFFSLALILSFLFLLLSFSKAVQLLVCSWMRLCCYQLKFQPLTNIPLSFSCTSSSGLWSPRVWYRQFSTAVVTSESCSLFKIQRSLYLLVCLSRCNTRKFVSSRYLQYPLQ